MNKVLPKSVLYLYIGTKIQQKKHDNYLQWSMDTTDDTHIAVTTTTESISHSHVSFQILFAFIVTNQLNYFGLPIQRNKRALVNFDPLIKADQQLRQSL